MAEFPGKGLYVITECSGQDFAACLDKTRTILDCGIAVLQYRDKSSDRGLRIDRCAQLLHLSETYDTCFVINDDVQLAEMLGVKAVHIGRDDPEYEQARNRLGVETCIGVSCYNELERALTAQDLGADYIAFGAFFKTHTKTGTAPATTELLEAARARLSVPIVAIGGITPGNAAQLLDAGADMLAVISSVYNADKPADVVNKYNRLFL